MSITDRDDLARRFAAEIDRVNDRLKHDISYTPTRWLQMIGEHGTVEAAKRLMRGGDTSDGFARLWEHGLLDLSVEWYVLEYSELFTDEERETAYRRLKLHDVPVDDWLRKRLGRRYP